MRLIRRAEVVILSTSMLVLPGLGAVTLHRLSRLQWLTIDWADPLAWIAHAPPEDIAGAILRHLGLIGCYWLATASVAYTAGRLTGFSRVVAALGPVTPRIVRTVADRVVVGAVALSSLGVPAAPAMADRHPPPIADPIEIRAAVAEIPSENRSAITLVPDDYLPYDPRPLAGVDTGHEPAQPLTGAPDTFASVLDGHLPHDPRTPTPAVAATRDRETVEVQRGDSLWLIASQHLTRHLGHPPPPDELRDHWHATIAANLPTLRSGDPDLIHPGEIITLPEAAQG